MCKKCNSKETIITAIQEPNGPDYFEVIYCSDCLAIVSDTAQDDTTIEDLPY